jgi:HEAT repeat protein
MAGREDLIARATKRDFTAVDALVAQGAEALEDVLDAIAKAKVSTADTLGDAVRRMTVPATADVSRFLATDVPLEAFTAAVDVLSRNGDPDGQLQRFVKATASDFETLRGAALLGIARTHDPKTAPFIHEIAKEADEESAHFLLADCIEALTMAGDHSLDEKTDALIRSRDSEIKLRAAALLPYLFFPALHELLGAASRMHDAEIRGKAVVAFYYLGTRRAAEALLKLSRDRDATVKEDAAASVALITGAQEPSGAAPLVEKLSDDVCWRFGQPIDLSKLAQRATQPNLRLSLAEELRVETGHDFHFNPSRPEDDAELVDRVRTWLEAHGKRFDKGGCYKFGFRQDLNTLA